MFLISPVQKGLKTMDIFTVKRRLSSHFYVHVVLYPTEKNDTI